MKASIFPKCVHAFQAKQEFVARPDYIRFAPVPALADLFGHVRYRHAHHRPDRHPRGIAPHPWSTPVFLKLVLFYSLRMLRASTLAPLPCKPHTNTYLYITLIAVLHNRILFPGSSLILAESPKDE
jgi:hypothetical protein